MRINKFTKEQQELLLASQIVEKVVRPYPINSRYLLELETPNAPSNKEINIRKVANWNYGSNKTRKKEEMELIQK